MQHEHRIMAVEYFNGTWNLINKKSRTEDEKFEMIHKAHASRYHWGFEGADENLARGEWLISRVYSVLSLSESALLHAERCLFYASEKQLSPYDFALACEALARAYSIRNERDKTSEYIGLALSYADRIDYADDREYVLSELKNIAV